MIVIENFFFLFFFVCPSELARLSGRRAKEREKNSFFFFFFLFWCCCCFFLLQVRTWPETFFCPVGRRKPITGEIQMESRVDGCWQAGSPYLFHLIREFPGLSVLGHSRSPTLFGRRAKNNTQAHTPGSNHLLFSFFLFFLFFSRFPFSLPEWVICISPGGGGSNNRCTRRETKRNGWRIGWAVIGRTRKQHLGTPIGLSSVSFSPTAKRSVPTNQVTSLSIRVYD